jgi:hypothetical protein
MSLRVIAAVACVLLTACNMKVTGIVTDRDWWQPVGACTVSAGERYTHTDPTGRYDLVTRWKSQQVLQFVAQGYAPVDPAMAPDARGGR